MRLRRIAFICFINISLLLIVGSGLAADDEASLTKQEKYEAQQAARRFVKRMQETRDVGRLIDEMFLPDFVSHFESGDESMSPSLYARLTKAERLRLFTVQINVSYLMALDVLSETDSKYAVDTSGKSAFKSILPAVMAERLRKAAWRDGEIRFSSYEEFQSRLPKIEKILSEARTHLVRQGFEQTAGFQRSLDDKVQDKGVNYRVRAYVGGDNIKDCEPLTGFQANQKFFRVETPLFMGVILIKDGDKMKIVRVTAVDGD